MTSIKPLEHSPFGPSQATRWINCPQSFYLHEQKPLSNIYADEGTVGHWIAEQCLSSASKIPKDYLHEVITNQTHPELKKLQFKIPVTESMVEAIQEYCDYIEGILGKISFGKPGLLIEKRVKLTEDCWGTCDCIILDKKKLELWIIDLKMGKRISVGAKNNYQLMIYGAAVLNTLKNLKSFFPRIVHLQIIQPRVYNEPALRTTDWTPENLSSWGKKLIPLIELIKSNEKTPEKLKINPAEAQCRWCSRNTSCRALAEYTFNMAGLEFKDYIKSDSPKLPSIVDIRDEEISNILKNLDLLSQWPGFIKTEALNRMKKGITIPGFKIIESSKNRQYLDKDRAEKILNKILGPKESYKTTILTPAQGEKKISRKVGKKTKGYILFQKNIHKPQGNPQIAPSSNKKPPMKFTAEEEFEEFKSK